MRKTLASLFLGAALLAPCGSALAQTPRPTEPHWGIKPERSAPALLDFARWLSERLRAAVPDDYEPAPAPQPAPVSSPVSGPGLNEVCPDRTHCPVG